MALTPAGGVPISNESLEGGYILAEVGGNTRRVPSGDFTSIANMAASTKLFDGQTVSANGEAFTYDAASTATADAALIVVSAAGGRLISTRREFASFDEFIADSRTFPAGTTLTIPRDNAAYTAVAGVDTGNLSGFGTRTDGKGTNAGGQEFDVLTLAGAYHFDDFGAAGDGVTDDYDVFVTVKNVANLIGRGFSLVFGEGKTYFIGRYIGDGLIPAADHLTWSDIGFLSIDLNGAKIKSNGSYYRDVSTKRQVMPFSLNGNKYVHVKNGELDGGIYETTRDAGVAEILCHGLVIRSENVVVENVWCHHWLSDGFYIGGLGNVTTGYYSPQSITMLSCRSSNNARQGISITMGGRFMAKNCDFEYSGFTAEAGGAVAGSYESHQPAAGCDIEPDVRSPRAPLDALGWYSFESCRFRGNHNFQMLCAHPGRQRGVRLKNCIIDGRAPDGSYHNDQYQFWPVSLDTVVEGCTIYGNIAGTSVTGVTDRLGKMMVRDTDFFAEDHVTPFNNRGFGVGVAYTDIRIEQCRFIWRSRLARGGSGTEGFPYFWGNSAARYEFVNNEIVVPWYAHWKFTDIGFPDAMPMAKFQQTALISENRYRVDHVFDGFWHASFWVNENEFLRNGNNVYRAVSTGQMGTVAPTHTSGTVSDGLRDFEYIAGAAEWSGTMLFTTAYSTNDKKIEGEEYLTATYYKPVNATTFSNPYFDRNARKQGGTAQRPLEPFWGQTYYDSVIGAAVFYSGTTWVLSDGTPA